MNLKALWQRDDGTAAAELAFLAPVLVLLVGGIIQVGAIVQAGMIASNAAREGARYAAVSDPNAATDALSYLQSTVGNRADLSLPALSSITVTEQKPANPVGSAVTVSVPLTVKISMPVMSNIFGSTFTITGGATMRVSQ